MKKLLSLLLAFIMVISVFTVVPFSANASTSLPNSIYITQATTGGYGTCTLASATMMLRARTYLSGNSGWASITESAVKPVAWGNGLKWSFTYSATGISIKVGHASVSGISVSSLKSILNSHPEGIVLYCGNMPHAVFITDYEGDTFYCADPDPGYSGNRRTLASSALGKKYGSQASVLSNTTAYWYVTSYSINNTPTPSFTYTSISTGKYYLKHNATGKYMNVSYGTDANKQNVDLYDGFYTAEVMNIISTSYGYKMRPECCTSRVINVWGDNPSSGANVTIYDDTAHSTQSWKFQAVSGGYIIHSAYNTSLVLDNNNGNVCVNTYTGGSSQIWSLVPYHTHNYNTHSHYGSEHPHYEYLKCSCGATQVNTSKTSYNSSCSSCNLTVNYNANGGSGAPDSQTKKYLSNLTLSSQTPYRDGYAFCGWSTSSTAYEASYFPGQAYSAHSGLTLYAVWKEIEESSYADWYNDHEYVYYDLPVSWAEAYKICESLGGHLVTISSEEENNFVLELAQLFDNNYCWLGGTDISNALEWYWINGEKFDYTNWSESEPNNSGEGEYFLEMYVNTGDEGTWNDSANAPASHVVSTGFVCEFENKANANNYSPVKTFAIGEHVYEVYDAGVDWQTAKKICKDKGGHLLTIEDVSEQAAIYQNIKDSKNDEFWLGISDLDSEGTWLDINGNSLTYSNWYSGEPNDDFNCEDYAIIKKTDGTWIDLKGFSFVYRSIGFICEKELVGGTTGDLTWFYDPAIKTLMLTGEGRMGYYDFGAPWDDFAKGIENLVIEEGSTVIDSFAFRYCTNISKISLPSTLKEIGGLENTKFYNDKTNWENGALYVDNYLIAVDEDYYGTFEVKHGTTCISSRAFSQCKEITKIILPDTVKYINQQAFVGCEKLTSLEIPNSVTDLGTNAFQNCTNLSEVVLSNSLEELTLHQFSGCSNLKSINIPSNIDRINGLTFMGCNNLEKIIIENPDCEINCEEDWTNITTFPKTATIYGYQGSTAQAYAEEHGNEFILIEEKPVYIIGDVDGDNKVSIMDATEIQRHIAQLTTITDDRLSCADANKDGQVNILDATHIQRFIAQLIPEL